MYFGSNVLPDGRVFVQGGEYSGPFGLSNFVNTGEIYNPLTNSWSNIATFPQGAFGDDPTEVLPDGRILTGYISGPQTYFYNPTTNAWSLAGTKLRNDQSDEEGWVKLPDNSILSYDIFASINTGVGHAQRSIPSTNTRVDAGIVPVQLSSNAVGAELGPGFLLPDGRDFYLGANGNTAYYTESTNSWTAGPVIPGGRGADDAPGAMLPDGKILFTADTPLFMSPAHIYEYDPVAQTYTEPTTGFGLPTNYLNGPSFVDRMLMLPTGQVLINNGGSQLEVYTPDLPPFAASTPTISGIAGNPDGSYTLTGTGLNGISEGAGYGDDAEMSSNYPILWFTDSSNRVFYARTFGWSSLVATGATPETTNFALPVGLPAGTYSVTLIANRSPSAPFTFTTPTNNNDPAPTVAVAATATPNPDPGTTASLAVLGADLAGESNLTYTWADTSIPSGAPTPTFSINGTNAARNDVAAFFQAGSYTFTVTITSFAGLKTTSSVVVTVNQTLTSLTVTPTITTIPEGGTQQFSASGFDQFGLALASPPAFSWSVVAGGAGGTVTPTGLYTAPSASFGTDQVKVTSGTLNAVATVTVTPVQATIGAVAVAWGTAGTSPLVTAGDGLRLLPSGRNTDLPWLNINSLTITLSQAETLSASDVTVTGLIGGSYGPVSISGSGTTYTTTLAQPIASADRLTLTIGNSGIATFTRRLDVLPGDVNDDGFVTSADVGLALDSLVSLGNLYLIFADINGDGLVDIADARAIRKLNGTTLPPLST